MTSDKVKYEIEKATKEGNSKSEVQFSEDLEHLDVHLVSKMDNPYKMIVEMSLNTWGDKGEKWKDLSPESRFHCVKEVLENRALPLAKESVKLNFYIGGITRASFDQIARARIGVVFGARGFKDNDLSASSFIVPYVFDAEDKQRIKHDYKIIMEEYRYFRKKYPGTWARYIMPMGTEYHFYMAIDYSALQQFCGSRMETTEQTDTVAVPWAMRYAVEEEYPLLADYLRPACDFAHKDRTVAVNGFHDILGIPHGSDNRWLGYDKPNMKEWWSTPCTDYKYLKKMGVDVVDTGRWKNYTWETLDERDKKYFEEE